MAVTAEWANTTAQTVNPGEAIIFTQNTEPCYRGFVRHRAGSGNFLLNGQTLTSNNCCRCSANRNATYLVGFGANIAIPEGGTVGEISVAIAVEGGTVGGTTMRVTPAAVENYFNVSRTTHINIFNNCCQTLSIRNTSSQPILVQEANVTFSRPDLVMTN